LAGGWGPGYLMVTLPAGITALGADVMTISALPQNVTVTLGTGESYTIPTLANPTRAFIGFTSTDPITTIRFSGSGAYAALDNFSYGSMPAEETPEPDTLIFGATGLAGLWLARRLRRFC
jgi:hypothetical protein